LGVWGVVLVVCVCVSVSGVLFSVSVCVCDLLIFLHRRRWAAGAHPRHRHRRRSAKSLHVDLGPQGVGQLGRWRGLLLGLYTILPLPILYGKYRNKGWLGGNTVLRNSVGSEGMEWAQTRGVFANISVDSCTTASNKTNIL